MHIEIAGRNIAFDDGGSKDARHTLVLLHAFPFDHGLWHDLCAPIRATHTRVICPDLRGFGGSTMGDGPASISDMADDVTRLLDALKVNRVVLGGLSMGGYVALAFAHAHPERLRALVLVDTRATADSPQAQAARDDAIRLVRGTGTHGLHAAMAARLPSANADTSVREKIRDLMVDQPDAICNALAAMRDRPDRSTELPNIRVPTLVVVGNDDVVTPPEEAAAMADAIPNARLVQIPGAGHLPNIERPGAFCEALQGFLAALPVN